MVETQQFEMSWENIQQATCMFLPQEENFPLIHRPGSTIET